MFGHFTTLCMKGLKISGRYTLHAKILMSVYIVTILSLVSCKRTENSVIKNINKNLEVDSTTKEYQFLDNGDIKLENLCRNGLHLGESGKNLLLDNYVSFLYHFLGFIEPDQTVL